MAKLTAKQAKLVKARVMDPHATLEQIGKLSGYASKTQAHRALNTPQAQDALAKCRVIMEQREKLSLGALMTRVEEGLEAMKVQSVKLDDSIISVSTETPDFTARHKYLETALGLHGALDNRKEDVATGPVNIAIVMAGGGSDAERQAISEVLAAARVARNLHPTENRLMTDEERGR